ncbi:hypothetical protein FRC10_006161, partial [Ceratobasidium sp. 414]
MYRAHKLKLSEVDLVAMEADLLEFNNAKDVFVDRSRHLKDLLKSEAHFNKIPKIHMLSHYTYLIRQLGTPCRYTTEITKLDCVKELWRATNHNNPIQQMISYLGRKEAWVLLWAYMHDTGLSLDSRFTEGNVDGDDRDEEPEDVTDGDNADEEPEHADGRNRDDVEGGRNSAGGVIWELTSTILIAKHPALGRRKAAYLMNKHRATDLVPATVSFLRSIVPPGTSIPISEHSFFNVWRRCKIPHSRLPFYPVLDPQTDQIRAFPGLTDEEGRVLHVGFFDTVLFVPTANYLANPGLH